MLLQQQVMLQVANRELANTIKASASAASNSASDVTDSSVDTCIVRNANTEDKSWIADVGVIMVATCAAWR